MKKNQGILISNLSAARIGHVILLFGIALRVYFYFFNPTHLTFDETLTHYLCDKYDFLEILFPERFGHVMGMHYPFIFLIMTKYLMLFFGNHLFVLRLIPFVSGILALVLFNKLKDIFLHPLPGIIAIFLMATNWRMIYYGMLAKPYSGDLLVTIILLLIFNSLRLSKEINIKKFVLYSLAGILSVWSSNPSIFILVAGMIALGFNEFLNKKEGKFNKKLLLIFIVWVFGFVLNYWCRLRFHTLDDSMLAKIWNDWFLINGGLWSSISYVLKRFLDMCRYLLSMPSLFSVFLLVMGCVWSYRHRRYDFLIMGLPFILTIAAAMMRRYVFFDRLLLFLLPIICILIPQGGYFSFALTKRKLYRYIILGLFAIMLFFPLKHVAGLLPKKSIPEVVVSKFDYAWANFKEGDVFLITPDLRFHFFYFNKTHQMPEELFVFSKYKLAESSIAKEINRLRKYKRVWFFVKSGPGSYPACFKSRLEKIGELKEQHKALKSHLYLYELFPPVEE